MQEAEPELLLYLQGGSESTAPTPGFLYWGLSLASSFPEDALSLDHSYFLTGISRINYTSHFIVRIIIILSVWLCDKLFGLLHEGLFGLKHNDTVI